MGKILNGKSSLYVKIKSSALNFIMARFCFKEISFLVVLNTGVANF